MNRTLRLAVRRVVGVILIASVPLRGKAPVNSLNLGQKRPSWKYLNQMRALRGFHDDFFLSSDINI